MSGDRRSVMCEGEGSVMYYRLAALPPAWIEVQLFILEDRVGRLFLLDPAAERLDRLDPIDANLLMQWYELSQVVSWHSLLQITQMLSTTRQQRPRDIGPKTRAGDRPPVAVEHSVATGIFELHDDSRSGLQI
jgi:hypothetical protein